MNKQQKPKVQTKKAKIFSFRNITLLVMVLFVAIYPNFKTAIAKDRVSKVCSSFEVGDSIEGIIPMAEKLELRIFSYNKREIAGKTEPAEITVMDGFIFSRWFCAMNHDGGKVTSKKLFSLD